jgi:diguanylate cyclase
MQVSTRFQPVLDRRAGTHRSRATRAKADSPLASTPQDHALHESREHLRAILNGIGDGVFSTDGRFVVRGANPAMARLSGYSIEEACGRDLLSFVAPRAHAALKAAVGRYSATGAFSGDVPLLCRDGSERLVRVTCSRVHDDLYVNVVRDLAELQREEQLERLAHTDALTTLTNRAAFQKRLEQETAAAVAGRHSTGVLLLSLRNFREINDTLGPDGGDQVLRETALRLGDASEGSDIVNARLGAAQFGILLPRVASPGALERHAHVLMAVLAAPIVVDGIPIEVTPCIGAALCPGDALRANDLLRRAGVAMHHARARHQVFAAYEAQQDRFSLAQLTLVSELRHAIARNQLELWYQPKLDLRSGRVDAVEALVRWRHPERGLVPPDEFIPAAERTGLIHALTAWVLRTAIHQARQWHDRGLRLNVAINISQSDLREDSLQTHLLQALEATGLPPSCVTLEITESAVMHDPKRAAAILGELRQRGVRISLDDFGTGQASLAHLQHLPVDEIKLDRSFVMRLPDGPSRSIAGATAMLAREFGLKSVAEGIESADSQRLLGDLGFDRIQGFHLSKPLPAPELEAWVQLWHAAGDAAPSP